MFRWRRVGNLVIILHLFYTLLQLLNRLAAVGVKIFYYRATITRIYLR
jgi:hypothetical protein